MVGGLDERNRLWRKPLLPGIPEKYRCLDTRYLSGMRKTWCPELHLDNLQDEFAIATILLDMGDCLKGGTSPYPLWEAIEDARFWMRLKSHHSTTACGGLVKTRKLRLKSPPSRIFKALLRWNM